MVSRERVLLMPTMEALAEYWAEEGLEHITPASGSEFPEGFDVYDLLKQVVGTTKSVLEIGCGYGRLCRAFSSHLYTGVDVNSKAVAAAREKNPGYRFEAIMPAAALPKADIALVYDVALHIPDNELARFLTPICAVADTVVIAEIMDRRWRRPGRPPVFNRDPEQYILEMANRGFLLRRFGKAAYERYNEAPWNINHDIRMSFHSYQRASN